MKKITSILIAITLLPACALAQNRRAALKAAEKAIAGTSAKTVFPGVEEAARRADQALRVRKEAALKEAQTQAAAQKAQPRARHESALLRSRLFNRELPTPVAAQRTIYQKQLAQALQADDFHWQPSKRLSKETRRLNLPLASNLLLNHKQDVIGGYALTQDYIEGYYLRRIHPYLAKPSYLPEKDGHLYRGIFMTVEELASTMKSGFSVKMNTWSVGSKNGAQFISFSSSTGEAMSYIFQGSGEHPNGIGVVFEVDKDLDGLEFWNEPQLNSTNTIYHCYKNVPAHKIRNVYVYGQYGLENLAEIIIKARTGEIKSNQNWVHDFDMRFLR